MNELIKPIRVEARPEYRLYVEFADGTKGEIDLSKLAGKGVFQVWNDYHVFKNVSIGDHREIKWGNEIELCADSLYLAQRANGRGGSTWNHPGVRRNWTAKPIRQHATGVFFEVSERHRCRHLHFLAGDHTHGLAVSRPHAAIPGEERRDSFFLR